MNLENLPKSDSIAKLDILKNTLADLEQSEGDNASKSQLRFDIAHVYLYDLRDLNEALDQTERALELADDNLKAKIYQQLSAIYFYQEDATQALEYAHLALQAFEANQQTALTGELQSILAALYMSQKDFSNALKAFETAIQLTLANKDYKNLGDTFFNLRAFTKEAVSSANTKKFYENYLNQYAEHPEALAFVLYNLGIWYHQDQNYVEALRIFEQSLQYKTTHNVNYELGSHHYWLATLNEQLGKSIDAANNYKKALELMLEWQDFQHTGIVIVALQYILEEIKDKDLKSEIQDLLHRAELEGFGTEEDEDMEESLAPEFSEEIINMQTDSFVGNLKDVADLENQKDLENRYEIWKANLPNDIEQFKIIAQALLDKLEKDYQNTWFSKAKKKKILDEKRQEIEGLLNG